MFKTACPVKHFQFILHLFISPCFILIAAAETTSAQTDLFNTADAPLTSRQVFPQTVQAVFPSASDRLKSERLKQPSPLAASPSPIQSVNPPVIQVQDLQPEPTNFQTDAVTLQGTAGPTGSVVEGLPPTTEPRALEWAAPDLQAASPTPDPVPFTLEEYIPEPKPNSFVQVNAEVGTTPDHLVEWRATLWGGAMTDNYLIETITFQGIELENSGLWGVGISRTVAGGNTVKVEGELQLFGHSGRQDHFEGTAALALRWEMSPSLSIALLEGVSYATALPEIEDDNNTDESQFLNYLAFEVEYSYNPAWAIAGRLHHRSGAYRQFGGAVGGSNAYLFGLRHRF